MTIQSQVGRLRRSHLWVLGGLAALVLVALAFPLYSHYLPETYNDLDGDWKQQGREEWLYITEGRWFSVPPSSEEALDHPHGTVEQSSGDWTFRDSNGRTISASVENTYTLLVLDGKTYGRIER